MIKLWERIKFEIWYLTLTEKEKIKIIEDIVVSKLQKAPSSKYLEKAKKVK